MTGAGAPEATSAVAAGTVVVLVMRGGSEHPTDTRLRYVDLYDLDALDLDAVSGLVVSSDCDQIFLERHRELLTGFVRAGGRVAVMGHVVTDFLDGLGRWQRLQYTGPKDLAVTIDQPHPVWEGVDPAALTVRRGVTGFYARGYPQSLPPGAVVTTRIGRHRLPLDYVYPLGAGEVLVHSGNDLAGWQGGSDSAARLAPQLWDWLAGA